MQLNALKLLPSAVKALIDVDDPMLTKFNTLRPEASLNVPNVLQTLPRHAFDLNDKEDPKLEKLNTDKAAPTLIVAPLTLNDEPKSTLFKTDMFEPKVTLWNTEVFEPTRLQHLSDKALPKCVYCNTDT
jgi:hypothetical protein